MASRFCLLFIAFLSACASVRGTSIALPADSLIEASSGQTTNLADVLDNRPVILALLAAPETIEEALSWQEPFRTLRVRGAVAKIHAILVLPADMRAYDALLREEYAEKFSNKGFDGVYLVYSDVEVFLQAFGQTAGKTAILLNLEGGHFITGHTSGSYTPQALYELRQASLPVLP